MNTKLVHTIYGLSHLRTYLCCSPILDSTTEVRNIDVDIQCFFHSYGWGYRYSPNNYWLSRGTSSNLWPSWAQYVYCLSRTNGCTPWGGARKPNHKIFSRRKLLLLNQSQNLWHSLFCWCYTSANSLYSSTFIWLLLHKRFSQSSHNFSLCCLHPASAHFSS